MEKGRKTHQSATLDIYLAALAIDGDRAAFELLYKKWHPKLMRFALRLSDNREDAEDIMQDSAIAIARNIGRLNEPARFSAWAYTIVRRRAHDQLTKTIRKRQLNDALLHNDQQTEGLEAEITLTLSNAISALPSDQRTLLNLFYLDGLTGPEISAAMGIPTGTVKSRLFAARGQLKELFEDTTKETPDE